MSDYMIRATAANGQIRAFAATTRDLTEYARNAHNTSPVVTAALGRTMTASVMMGSTETTFYAIAVYFGSVGIKKTRHAIPAALMADTTGYIMSVLAVNLFFR